MVKIDAKLIKCLRLQNFKTLVAAVLCSVVIIRSAQIINRTLNSHPPFPFLTDPPPPTPYPSQSLPDKQDG